MRLYEEYACEVHGINSVMKGLAIGGLNIHHGLIVLAIKKELNANIIPTKKPGKYCGEHLIYKFSHDLFISVILSRFTKILVILIIFYPVRNLKYINCPGEYAHEQKVILFAPQFHCGNIGNNISAIGEHYEGTD